MFDYFVAAMKCPSCGTVSPADTSTNMQTHLRDDARGIELGVGYQLDPRDLGDDDILDRDLVAAGAHEWLLAVPRGRGGRRRARLVQRLCTVRLR
jgi:hypothetical protein